MSKLLKFSYVLTVLFAVTLASCSTQQSDDFSAVLEETPEVPSWQFEKLCASIDSLNASFMSKGSSPSSATPNRISEKTVTSLGKHALTFTVDACASAFGGIFGSFIASYVYGEYLDYCIEKVNKPLKPHRTAAAASTFPSYVYAGNERTSYEDSVGYYHNKAMEVLTSNDKQYVTNDTIDYPSLLVDGTDIIKELGIYDKASTFENIEDYVFLTDTIIKSFYMCYNEEITMDEAFDRVNLAYASKHSDDKVTAAITVEKKMVAILQTLSTEQEVVEYADALNTLYKQAEIDPELKKALKQVTNVAVNSKMYWNGKYEIQK